MLVLTRSKGQRLKIGNDITLTVVEITGSKAKIGIDAPAETLIRREELLKEDRVAIKSN